MTDDTSQQPDASAGQQNGFSSDQMDDEERAKMRPVDIDADVREMERRKRVELIMNSKLFREELERIIETQLREGNGPSGLLQQISDMVGVSRGGAGNAAFKSSGCVIPINDIRGIEAMGYAKGEKILRCKLASLFRLIDLLGWAHGPGTLITARLNQDEEQFLVNPYGVLFHEVTASGLVKVDARGQVIEQGTTNFPVLLLTNQGALCCGATVEEAFFNARNAVLASETQLKLLPIGLDNVVVIDDEIRKKMYEQAHNPPESTPRPDQPSILESKVERKWRVGGVEFESLMRMLDNAGFRTGYIYRQPLIKHDPPKPKNDVEVPPAVSSLGYLLEEEELYRQGLWRKLEGGRKGHDRSRWLNSPNTYQKVEILETGTPDPKKITKIKDYRRADKISAGPQSHILEGVTWEEARKMQDAAASQTGDHVVLMGAASKGIIQRGHQHNAAVYKAPYAKNPFDCITDEELDEYKKVVEKKTKGDYDTDYSESEGLSSAAINKRMDGLHIRSPTSVTSETEEESRDGHKVYPASSLRLPFYRTHSHAGFPKGSYSIPNPKHFHIARQTQIAVRKPIIVTIRPQNASSNHLFNHGGTTRRSTVTLNLGNPHSVTLDIPMDTLRGFILPFANALNLRNVPTVLSSTSSQTAYMNNFEHVPPTAEELNHVHYTPIYVNNYSRTCHLTPETANKTESFEKRILDDLQQQMINDLNETSGSEFESLETDQSIAQLEKYGVFQFTEHDQASNESPLTLTPEVVAMFPSSSSSSKSDVYKATVQTLGKEDGTECYQMEKSDSAPEIESDNPDDGNIDDFETPYQREVERQDFAAIDHLKQFSETNDEKFGISDIIEQTAVDDSAVETGNESCADDDGETDKAVDKFINMLEKSVINDTLSMLVDEDQPKSVQPKNWKRVKFSVEQNQVCPIDLDSKKSMSQRPRTTDSAFGTQSDTYLVDSDGNTDFEWRMPQGGAGDISVQFIEKLERMGIKDDNFSTVKEVISDVKHILHEISAGSIDEGIDDSTYTISDRSTTIKVTYDENVTKLSTFIFEYLVQQCHEIKELVLFPEISHDANLYKLINKLIENYKELFAEKLNPEEKNTLRLQLATCTLQLLEIDEKRNGSGESDASNTVSDKIFSISEYLNDVLDSFFNSLENYEKFSVFSKTLSEKQGTTSYSTPETDKHAESEAESQTTDQQPSEQIPNREEAQRNVEVEGGVSASETRECKRKTSFLRSQPFAKSSKVQHCYIQSETERTRRAKAETEVLPFKKGSSPRSGAENYWISLSPKLSTSSPKPKRRIINFDDIPLKPPDDLLPQYMALSPIPEEHHPMNLFQSHVTDEELSSIFDLNVSNVLDEYEICVEDDEDGGEEEEQFHSILTEQNDNDTNSYVSFDRPEVNVVVCSEVNFYRTKTVNTCSYVKSNVAIFTTVDSENKENEPLNDSGENTVNGDHSDAHMSTLSQSSKEDHSVSEGSPKKDKKKKKGLRTPSFLKKKKEKKIREA
nr:unnamed protein product [Callosobruchus chinensis]